MIQMLRTDDVIPISLIKYLFLVVLRGHICRIRQRDSKESTDFK